MSDLRAVLDRIEGQLAVLLVGDDEYRLILPRRLLPKEATEGSVLSISIVVDRAATQNAKNRVRNLIDRLSEGED